MSSGRIVVGRGTVTIGAAVNGQGATATTIGTGAINRKRFCVSLARLTFGGWK
jgi:hypothetical protein